MDNDLQSIQEARDLVERAHRAWLEYRSFPQERVDQIVAAMAAVATANAEKLARLAVEETTYGKVEDKVQKNLFSSQRVFEAIRNMRTVGVIAEDAAAGVLQIGTPVGVIAAILPSTNPTSTAIYKILIALKAGNSIVVSPHPAATRCICEAVSLMAQAALAQGAPEDVICCFLLPSVAGTQELMKHRRTAIILATGGMGIVRAAYSSGKPAFGVGPGNVPVFIDSSANIPKAVADTVFGKTFDWGTICSSEQAIVAEESLRAPITEELRRQRAHFCDAQQTEALSRTLMKREPLSVNPKCVGQSPQRLAQMAGFTVAPDARLLVVELREMGREVPLSAEKLSPVLALYFVKDRGTGFELCSKLLHFGGLGHTCVIHAQDDAVVREYGQRMPAYRVVVNSPAPQGSIGASTNLFPAMTLGCGAAGGNITSDNIGPQHLINIKRIAWERRPVTTAVPPQVEATAAACACPPHAGTPYVPAQSAARDLPDRASIHRIVDRFLAEKRAPAASSLAAPSAKSAPQPPETEKPRIPAKPVVEFVCENDVRDAIRQNRTIVIGPKTLLTPAARDLGYERGVFEGDGIAAKPEKTRRAKSDGGE